jgi:hypothetical protein
MRRVCGGKDIGVDEQVSGDVEVAAVCIETLGPRERFARVQVRPRAIDLCANNPIARKLKVTANLAAGNHGGCIDIVGKSESDALEVEFSIDLVISPGAAELAPK